MTEGLYILAGAVVALALICVFLVMDNGELRRRLAAVEGVAGKARKLGESAQRRISRLKQSQQGDLK